MLEIKEMKGASIIAGTKRGEQWQEGTHNEEIKEKLGRNIIDEAIRVNRNVWGM